MMPARSVKLFWLKIYLHKGLRSDRFTPNGGENLARGKKRLTRRDIKEDELGEFFVDAWKYVHEHSRQVAGIVAFALIAAIIVSFAIRERRAAQENAQVLLAQGNAQLAQGNFRAALDMYGNVIDKFRGTQGHSDAIFFAANAHFLSGNYDSALVFFQRYLNIKKRREEFTISAEEGIAQCLEEIGRYKEAADAYLKVQREHPDSELAPDALMGAGRCYELAGDFKQAEKVYKELLDLYPDSNEATAVKMPLLELQARLENS